MSDMLIIGIGSLVLLLIIAVIGLVVAKRFLGLCVHRWGDAFRNDLQRCEVCGAIRRIPLVCEHSWEEIRAWEESRGTGQLVRSVWVLRCKHCGDMKHHVVDGA